MNNPKSAGAHDPWIQLDQQAALEFSKLAGKSPAATQILAFLIAQMARENAFIISQAELGRTLKLHKRTVQRATETLVRGNWIRVLRLGSTGGVNAYVVNSRVAWKGRRAGLRHAIFSARVWVGEAEQPARPDPHQREPELRDIGFLRTMARSDEPEQLDIERYIAEHDS